MKLKEWLSWKSITQEDFGQKVGVTQQAVATYVLETSIPRRETMQKIIEVTDGAVLPADFYA